MTMALAVAQQLTSTDLVKIGFCIVGGAAAVYAVKRTHDLLSYYPFPGPRGNILGITLPVTSPETLEPLFLQNTDDDFNPVSLRLNGLLLVLTANEQDIRQSYFKNRPDQLRRSPIYSLVFDAKPGCPGLFTADDDEWKRQHRAYAPAFSAQNVSEMLPLICARTAALMQKWEKLVTVEDIAGSLRLCTTDIICEAALGLKFDYLERAEKPEAETDERIELLNLLHLRFTDSTRKLLRDTRLALVSLLLPKWIALRWEVIRTSFERAERSCEIIEKLIKRKHKEIKEDPAKAKRRCLMDQALLHMLNNGGTDTWTEKQMLSMLTSNFGTFFIAGSETTSNTAAWLMYFLCAHPVWQTKCRTQVFDLLKGRHWSTITGSELKQLPALRACLYESIRLSPTVPVMGARVKVQDFTLRGKPIPKGSFLISMKRLATTVASRLEDPMEFKPERWIDGRTGCLKSEHDVGAGVLVFGGGPRACPGRNLAESEVTMITLATLATFNTWTMLQDKGEVKRVDVTTVAPGPLSIRFENV